MGFQIENGVLIRYLKESGETIAVIPAGVTEIGRKAFRKCSRLREIILPDGVERIGDEAFHYCTGLQKIQLPESLMTIGERAFSWCNALEKIHLPPRLEVLPESAFHGCTLLQEVVLPAELKGIGRNAFAECRHLGYLELPEGLECIEENAFQGCIRLAKLHVPDTVRRLSSDTLDYTSAEYVTNDGFVIIGDGILYQYCGKAFMVRLPQQVRQIMGGAFATMSDSSAEICIPDTLAEIHTRAFRRRQIFRLTRGNVSVRMMYYIGSQTQERENVQFVKFLTEPDISRREELFNRMRTSDYKIPAAAFMAAAYGEPFYQKYLRTIGKRAVEFLIRFGDAQTLGELLPCLCITKQNIDGLIEFAISQQQLECQTLLLRQKADRIGYRNAESYFKL